MNDEVTKVLNDLIRKFEDCKNSTQSDHATVERFWCNQESFSQAQMATLGVLENKFGKDNLYFVQFKSQVIKNERRDIEKAIGILKGILVVIQTKLLHE